MMTKNVLNCACLLVLDYKVDLTGQDLTFFYYDKDNQC
jgi:hypothetical protein